MFFGPVNLFNYPKQWRDYRMLKVPDCFGDYDYQEDVCKKCDYSQACKTKPKKPEISDHAKAMQQASGIDATLQERGKRYGPFDGHARITQNIKSAMNDGNWSDLSSSHKEALEMIAHKIGRILNGDPNYDDSWRDIAGYATLIEKQLNGQGR